MSTKLRSSVLLTALLVGCFALPKNVSAATVAPLAPTDAEATTKDEAGPIRVIIQLATNVDSLVTTTSWQQVVNRRMAITRDQNSIERSLAGTSSTVLHRFTSLPAMSLSTDDAGLAALQRNPLVASIERDLPMRVELNETASHVQADDMWTSGYTGDGQAIAIIDTGVDRNHPMFSDGADGSRVVSEGCYSSAEWWWGETSMCPNEASSVTGEGVAMDCPTSVAGCGHGTHVAGIAAGGTWSAGGTAIRGVAPDADILAFAVFTEFGQRFGSYDPCGGSYPCALSYLSDQLLALERVEALSTAFDIASVNMSLGGGLYGSCPGQVLAQQIGRLKELGISTVIASGNDGTTGAISAPACIPDAVAVGATTIGDQVAWYTNTAEGLVDLYAPGSGVLSAYPNSSYRSFSGTSMATPHVAGALALLREKRPDATPQEMLLSLQTIGVGIDVRESSGDLGFSIPRIAIHDAANILLPPLLEVDTNGDGLGTVLSEPSGIDCGATCVVTVTATTTYELTATADIGSEFVAWTGCDAVDGDICTVMVVDDSVAVTAEFHAIPADHDNFGEAHLIVLDDEGSFVDETSTLNATIETGEPTPECATRFGASVWYSWTAPLNGTLSLSSVGSTFDTVIGVYSGDSVDALIGLACNDDSVPDVNVFSELSFDATLGTTYHIQVGGWESDTGILELSADFVSLPFSPVEQQRILDTRFGGKVGALDGTGEARVLQVTGVAGVPSSGVSAVALNVTVTQGEMPDRGGGYVTVYPCGDKPDASSLNFSAGQTVPNAVIAPVSATGTVCFYVYGKAHLLADVSGYFSS